MKATDQSLFPRVDGSGSGEHFAIARQQKRYERR